MAQPMCLCPRHVLTSIPSVRWPWTVRNRTELHQIVKDLGEETHEWLLVLYVTEDLRLISAETVGQGGIATVEVPVGRIIHRGLVLGASAFFLAHNHPSGDPTPSLADIKTTARIVDTAEAMGLPLLQHVVVAGNEIKTVGYW